MPKMPRTKSEASLEEKRNLHVVNLDVAIVRRSDEERGVWREAETSDGHGMTPECVQEFSGSHVEDVDDSVYCPAGYVLTVGTLNK